MVGGTELGSPGRASNVLTPETPQQPSLTSVTWLSLLNIFYMTRIDIATVHEMFSDSSNLLRFISCVYVYLPCCIFCFAMASRLACAGLKPVWGRDYNLALLILFFRLPCVEIVNMSGLFIHLINFIFTWLSAFVPHRTS